MVRGARNYKAEYERRINNAITKGKTRQQARGHREREHIARAEREREELGVSGSEVRSITAWCGRYNNEVRDVEDVIDFARSNGYAAFVQYRDTWKAARRQYLREQAAGTYSSRGMSYLESLTSNAGVDEIAWLYYH